MANLYTVGIETEEILTSEEVKKLAQLICQQLKDMPEIKKVHYVASYHPQCLRELEENDNA